VESGTVPRLNQPAQEDVGPERRALATVAANDPKYRAADAGNFLLSHHAVDRFAD